MKHETRNQEGIFLGAIITPMTASLIAPMASSLIKTVGPSFITSISRKRVTRAGKRQESGILTFNDKSSGKRSYQSRKRSQKCKKRI